MYLLQTLYACLNVAIKAAMHNSLPGFFQAQDIWLLATNLTIDVT